MNTGRLMASASLALWSGLGLAGCGGSGGGPTAPPAPTPVNVTPATTLPPPTTTLAGNQPPQIQFRVTPREGPAPLTVEANLCGSTDPENDPITPSFDFGDGSRESGFCRPQHTYRSVGRFTVQGCITDGRSGHDKCETLDVNVTAPQPVSIGLTITARGCMVDISVDVGGLASGGIGALAVSRVTARLSRTSATTASLDRVGSTSRWEVRNVNIAPLGAGRLDVTAEAIDGNLVVGRRADGTAVSCP